MAKAESQSPEGAVSLLEQLPRMLRLANIRKEKGLVPSLFVSWRGAGFNVISFPLGVEAHSHSHSVVNEDVIVRRWTERNDCV